MTLYQKGSEKVENYREYRYFTTGQMGGLAREKTSRLSLERDKKTRREIANSNERRRMQSINSGFQQLKALLPDTEDDKRSKSVILHQAVEHITKLESEKLHLLSQNSKLMCLVKQEMDGRMVTKRKRINCPGDSNNSNNDDDNIVVKDAISPLFLEGKLDAYYQADNVGMLRKLERLVRELRAQLEEERRRRLACERQLDSIKVALRSSSSSSALTSSSSSSSSTLLSPTSSSLSPIETLMTVQKCHNAPTLSSQVMKTTTTTASLLAVMDANDGCDGVSGSVDVMQHDDSGGGGDGDGTGADSNDGDDEDEDKERISIMISGGNEDHMVLQDGLEDDIINSIVTSQQTATIVNNVDSNVNSNSMLTTTSAPSGPTKMQTTMTYSMSRRNLETIVEAIRHLEGDHDSPFTTKVVQQQQQRQQQQQQKATQQQLQKQQQQQQQQQLSIIPQILIQQQLVQQHQIQTMQKLSQKHHHHQTKKAISQEHQVLKLLQHQQQQQQLQKSTSLLQIAKNLHLPQQQQQQQQQLTTLQSPQFISLIQPSSPYCSPLSSPPLSSTPPQMIPLTSPHHFLSPIIICSPNSSFLKGATQLASLTTLDQS